MKAKHFFHLALISILVSCSFTPNENYSTIEGQLPKLASKDISFGFKDSLVKTAVNSDGYFHFNIPLKTYQYVYSKELNRKLFLLPSDSLYINGTADKYIFNGGQSALINNYYTNWKEYLHTVADTANSKKYYSQKPYDFLKSVDSWIKVWLKPLVELQTSYPNLNPDFISFEKLRIKYWMYSDLNDYKSLDIPIDFYKYLESVSFNEPTLLQLDEYKYFLSSYVFMRTRNLETLDKLQITSKMLDVIEETFYNERVKNEVSKEVIRIQTNRLAINDTLLKRFKNICKNDLYISKIENEYQTLKHLLKGTKAPEFELIDLDGSKAYLNDFKGKYLLIDVWSTTCTPCIREFPYLEKLRNEFENRDLKIITACLSNETAWKRALTKYGLKHDQFRIENGWSSSFKDDYIKSSGVPLYILIDPNGFLIDARAPKPSENLKELIYSLDGIKN